MFKSVYIVRKLCSETAPEVVAIASALEQAAEKNQMFVLTNPDQCTAQTLVVAIGGDGTMLYAMQIAVKHGSTAMGINLGRIGFLTDFVAPKTHEEAVALFEDVFEYAGIVYPLEERLTLMMWGGATTFVAGNEISVSRAESDSLITYKLRFDDVDAGIYRANSIMVSSPMGSTAYSLSAGGALMLPSIPAMQIVAVAPLTMTARPIVVSEKTLVEIQAWGGKISVRADGQVQNATTKEYTKEKPFTLFVKGNKFVKVLHNKDWNYFDMLTQKLGWIKE